MQTVTESFNAYTPSGEAVEITVRNLWEEPRPLERENREAFCVKHGFIVPTTSCAVSCVMAALQGKEYL